MSRRKGLLGIPNIPELQNQLGWGVNMAEDGTLSLPWPKKVLAQQIVSQTRAGRHPLAAGVVHTLLEERLMKGPCLFLLRKGLGVSLHRKEPGKAVPT
jgi:hypothetical protein